jgi:hypothetical protein
VEIDDEDILELTRDVDPESPRAVAQKTHAVYMRVWGKLDRFLKAIDTTTEHGASRRHTRGENASAARHDREERIVRQHDVLNNLIRASLVIKQSDGAEPLAAIPHWKGDVTIDGHHMTFGLLHGNADEALTAVPRAKASAHVRRLKYAMAIDITAVVVVGRPTDPYVPSYITSAVLGDPKGADTPGALLALDIAERNGFRPRSGTKHQYCIVDMGFSNGIGFNAGLLARDYTLIAETDVDARNLHNLDSQGSTTGGPLLFNGQIFCPGMRPLMVNEDLGCPKARAETPEWVDHRERERRLLIGRMPTNGRPVATPLRRRGRPRADQSGATTETVYRVPVQCPARAGYAVCSLLEGRGIAWKDGTGRIPAPPAALSEADLPDCCRQMTTTVTMNESQFKQYQGFVRGSEAHRDWYEMARAQNERAFARLTDPTGANLRDRTVRQKKDGMIVILVGMAIAVANIKARQRYETECNLQQKDSLSHERRELILDRDARVKAAVTAPN